MDIQAREKIMNNPSDPIAKCDLCKKSLYGPPLELGKWVFHPGCFQIAEHRLARFMDLILLPEDEFNEWLADDSQ